MTKKRKTKKVSRKKGTFFAKYKKIVSLIIITIIAISTAYGVMQYYNYYLKTTSKKSKISTKNQEDKDMIDKMSQMLEKERTKVDVLKKELKKIKKKYNNKYDKNITSKKQKKNVYSSEYVDYKKSLEMEKDKEEKIDKNKNIISKKLIKKPMIGIIIDDVAFASETKKIKSLPFKVTPSFFPPTKRHPNTPKYAREFSFYMVHLPMEALHYPHPEPKTLKINQTKKDIAKRMSNIKKWFPKSKFINNHTGSKFTANYSAMRKFYAIISKDNLIFIDSRTNASTVVPKVAKEFNQKLLSRDIFLDNIANIRYIKNQLKKAVKIAKKRGYAIAIGHPHPKTLQALKESKILLKGVEPVYISTIYENIRSTAK